jgi:hypothetical protein
MESFKTLSNAYKGLPLRGCWEFLIVGLMYCHNAKSQQTCVMQLGDRTEIEELQ